MPMCIIASTRNIYDKENINIICDDGGAHDDMAIWEIS